MRMPDEVAGSICRRILGVVANHFTSSSKERVRRKVATKVCSPGKRRGETGTGRAPVRIRHFVCIVVVAVLQAQPTASGQEIRISHQWAEATDGRDRAARVFAQEVEARAKGLKLRAYPNSSLNISPTEILDALQSNALDMAVYPLTYAVTKAPEFSLSGLPGLVPDLEAAQALKGSEIHAMLQSLAEAHGIRILTWWWAPGGLFAQSKVISDPTSVRGLKMRGADPLFELMLKEAGASVANMPSTDVYPRVQGMSVYCLAHPLQILFLLALFRAAKFCKLWHSRFNGLLPSGGFFDEGKAPNIKTEGSEGGYSQNTGFLLRDD